jgi:hypothetical protein
VFVVASGQFTSANKKTRLFYRWPARAELPRLQSGAPLGEISKQPLNMA